ncbi:MAG: GAF domain-containing protein, partial [Candidatus Promineifilaceae bacterium]|nr:GAF domain-containing protein [Candidatus Promineifilaceae bacterium]
MVDKPAGQGHTLNAKLVLQKEQVVACNHDAQLLFDCEREEILGHSLLAFSPPQQPDGRQSLAVLRQRTVAALSREPQDFTWEVRRPSGGTMMAEAHLQPLEAHGRTLAQLTLQVQAPPGTDLTDDDEEAATEEAPDQLAPTVQAVEAEAPPSQAAADLVALAADEPESPVATGPAADEPVADTAADGRSAAAEMAGEGPAEELVDGPASDEPGTVDRAEDEPRQEEEQPPESTASERPALDPANEQLRHFKLGIERSNDAIFVTDVDGTITYVNRGFEQVYGYTAEEALGQTPRILKSGVLTKSVYEAFWQTLLAKEVVSGEIINRSKDGRLLHIEGTNSPILTEDEELIGFLGIHRDITERKRAEEALREARDQLEERVVERTQELTDANLQLLERNAELEQIRQELQQRNRILETLGDLTQQTTVSEPNLAPIFEATIRLMADVVDATSACLLEIDEDQGTSTVVAEYFAPEATTMECQPSLGATFSLAEDFTDTRLALVEQARPYVLRLDDPNLDPGDRAALKQNDAQVVLGIPLLAHGRAIAEITLWDSRRARSFSDDEIELLQSIASQVAVPIENARLYDQTLRELNERRELEQQIQESLEQRSRQVRLSTQLSRQIAEAPDLNDLYERVVTQVKEQFGFYHVQLLRYEPVLEAVVLMAGYGQTGRLMKEQGHRMVMGQGLIGQAAKTGRPVLRPNVSRDPDWRPNPLLPETQGELAVPIMLGDEVLGVLDVQSNEVDGLTSDDQLVLEGLCAQIAIAIEETRLRQEMADQLAELERLQQIMSREGWLSYQAQRRGRLGYRFTESSLLHPVSGEELDTSEGEEQQHQQQVMSAPMRVRGQVIGALGIEGDANHPLTPEERELVDSISEQVAEALESARLLQQTQKHAIEMEAVAQVSAAASTILDAPKLLQTVANLSKERFDLHHVAVFVLENDTLQWEAGTSLPESAGGHPGPRSVAMEAPNSAVAKAARLREPIVIDDLR